MTDFACKLVCEHEQNKPNGLLAPFIQMAGYIKYRSL